MSWIVLEKASKKVVCELLDKRSIDNLNTEKYEVIPAYEYLCQLNKELKNANSN